MGENENLLTIEWLLKCAASLAILGKKGWIKLPASLYTIICPR
jgi:hypothetical protein